MAPGAVAFATTPALHCMRARVAITSAREADVVVIGAEQRHATAEAASLGGLFGTGSVLTSSGRSEEANGLQTYF